MKITGIICEYNPLHLGHAKQIAAIRQNSQDEGIVCLMSGNYVQRGMPAIFDKSCRAKAAVHCGADLILELPVTAALSSAEGFAAEGVRILSGFCDALSFGAENTETEKLMEAAEKLLSPIFSDLLKQELSAGCSFPAAREKALTKLGINRDLISKPNNILAVEYCKAILAQNAKIKPSPIYRDGDYHSTEIDSNNPSATSLRLMIENGQQWSDYIPEYALHCFTDATIHTIQAGERAILARLRTMTDDEFEMLPYGSEGLWRKLMKNCRSMSTLEDIIQATKSKRYTRTRLDRMVMCAFLGITQNDLQTPAPYVRVLALNDKGRSILTKARETGSFINIGEKTDCSYQALECRCDDLYGLFSNRLPESAGVANNRRIYLLK